MCFCSMASESSSSFSEGQTVAPNISRYNFVLLQNHAAFKKAVLSTKNVLWCEDMLLLTCEQKRLHPLLMTSVLGDKKAHNVSSLCGSTGLAFHPQTINPLKLSTTCYVLVGPVHQNMVSFRRELSSQNHLKS